MRVNNVLLSKAKRSGFLTKVEVISRQPAEQENYQVQVEDIISRKGDGEDILFFQKNDILNHWKESYASWKSSVWAKLPNLPVTKTQILNLLSGHPSVSNGMETFEFFDDFESSYFKTSITDSNFSAVGLYEGSNPVVPVSTPGTASDAHIHEEGNILIEPSDPSRKYKFFYTGFPDGGGSSAEKIHYAYSEDGKNWTKSSANPVINDRRAEDPYVVKSGSTYYLYAEDKQAGGENRIRRWHSSDCESWTDDGQISGIGDHEQSPVVWIEGETWYLIYEQFPTAPNDIRLATSSDGMSWTNEATNPVMSAGDTDWVTGAMVPDDIVKVDSTYYLLYHGYRSSTSFEEGLATSTNLTTWTDSPNSPLDFPGLGSLVPTAMLFYDTEWVILHNAWQTASKGVYRGYPLSAASLGNKLFEAPNLNTSYVRSGIHSMFIKGVTATNVSTFSVSLGQKAFGTISIIRWMYLTGTVGRQTTITVADSELEADSGPYIKFDGGNIYAYSGSSWVDTGFDFTAGSWHRVEIIVTSGDLFDLKVGDENWATGISNYHTISNIDKIWEHGPGTAEVDSYRDDYCVRKYASPEPLLLKRKISGKAGIIKSVCGGIAG